MASVAALTPVARQSMAEQARQIVATHYTWEGIADAYEALMQAEVAGAVPPAARP